MDGSNGLYDRRLMSVKMTRKNRNIPMISFLMATYSDFSIKIPGEFYIKKPIYLSTKTTKINCSNVMATLKVQGQGAANPEE
jgi:hypothetical protein